MTLGSASSHVKAFVIILAPYAADIPITRRTRRGVVVHPTAADTAAGLFPDGPFDLEAYVAEQPDRTAEVAN